MGCHPPSLTTTTPISLQPSQNISATHVPTSSPDLITSYEETCCYTLSHVSETKDYITPDGFVETEEVSQEVSDHLKGKQDMADVVARTILEALHRPSVTEDSSTLPSSATKASTDDSGAPQAPNPRRKIPSGLLWAWNPIPNLLELKGRIIQRINVTRTDRTPRAKPPREQKASSNPTLLNEDWVLEC